MFGDNKTVACNVMTPHGKVLKRHVALSFHRARESIAAKIANFLFVDGKINTADALNRHWDHHDV